MKRIKILINLLIGFMFLSNPVWAAKITAEKVGSKINISVDDKFFTSYIFSADEKYPFFFPVNGPLSGGSVTSMRNDPYPHHSSLYFACDAVNGGNYWQEGLERGRIISVNAEIIKQGGDVKILRKHLPGTFLNIRLSPVEIINQTNDEIRATITRLVKGSDNPYLTGVCCINMNDKVEDEKVLEIFKTVENLREEYRT